MSLTSTIGFLAVGMIPVVLDAKLVFNDSLTCDLEVSFKPSDNVSNTNLVSFTVDALSNAFKTFTFYDSVKFLALKILLV